MRRMRFVNVLVAALSTVLSLNAWGSTYQVLYNFTGGTDGGFPVDGGVLAIDSSGNLYGTTLRGGTCNLGTLFELSPNPNGGGWIETVLHSFCGQDGNAPEAGLFLGEGTEGEGVILFGTTTYGGSQNVGTAFSFTNPGGFQSEDYFSCDASTFTCLPYSGWKVNNLLIRLAGYAGGANGRGGLFGVFGLEYSFCSLPACPDGANPANTPVEDAEFNDYGTTELGGASNQGVVYEFGGSGAYTVLHSFAGGPSDGAYPFFATILMVPSCSQFLCQTSLWGTTPEGGAFGDMIGGYGTVWSINGFGTFTLIHSFDFSDGAWPFAGLINVNGTLYGTTNTGGRIGRGCCQFGLGTIYSLTQSGTLTTLHVFTGSDGALPYSGLVADSSGNLYGVTFSGGAHNAGVVYEITP
jgi:uncharacterized repeat protein (TIGR03803 family)